MNGKPIIEHVSYYTMNKETAQRVQHLIEEHNKNVRRSPIEITLKAEVPGKFLRRFAQFYDNLDLGAFDT